MESEQYSLETEAVKIKGNVKTQDGEYQIYPFTIEQKGFVISLSDDKGVPNWGNKGANLGKGNKRRQR